MPNEVLALALVDHDSMRRPAEAIEDAAAGPGWFDSSWDLRRGLVVREAWPDERADLLADDFVQRSTRVGCLRTSSRTAAPRSITAIA